MSHCLQAADAYLNLVKVKWSSSSQKDVLGWVFNLMGDSFILFGWGEPNNIADIFIYVRWDFDQTITDQLAYRKVGKVVDLLGLLLESDKQTVKKRNLSGSKSNWLSASCFCQWRRQWQAIPVLLPGKSHGWRSLVGCSPWGREESDTTDDFTFTFHFHTLEKEMATHSSVLAWRIPGMGKPGGLPSMGSHRVGHDWSDLAAAAAAFVEYEKHLTALDIV